MWGRLVACGGLVGRSAALVLKGHQAAEMPPQATSCQNSRRMSYLSGRNHRPTFDRVSKAATEARTQNRIPGAIGLYRQAVKLRPSWAEGWWFLGELLYDQNQYPEARDALRRLIRTRS